MGKHTQNNGTQKTLEYNPNVAPVIVKKAKPAGAEVPDVSAQLAALTARLAAIEAENTALKANASKAKDKKALTVRVSESGCITAQGPTRTLPYYSHEWEEIIKLCRDDKFVATVRELAKDPKAIAGSERSKSGVKWADVKPAKKDETEE